MLDLALDQHCRMALNNELINNKLKLIKLFNSRITIGFNPD